MTDDSDEHRDGAQRDEEPIDLSRGEEKVVTCSATREKWPFEGEEVTFKAVSGQLDQEVVEVDKSRDLPIKLDNGGWYERTSLVEYTKEVDWKVVEMPDGTEVYVEELGPTDDGQLVTDGGTPATGEQQETPRTDICEGCEKEIVAEVERVEGKHELIHQARTAEEGFMSAVGGSVEIRFECLCSSVVVEFGPGSASAWEFPDEWMWPDNVEEVADRVA